jgi:hypothetical protein
MRSRIQSYVALAIGVMAMAASVMPVLHAQVPSAPEIDSSSIVSGLTLASAAVLMLRARRRSK